MPMPLCETLLTMPLPISIRPSCMPEYIRPNWVGTRSVRRRLSPDGLVVVRRECFVVGGLTFILPRRWLSGGWLLGTIGAYRNHQDQPFPMRGVSAPTKEGQGDGAGHEQGVGAEGARGRACYWRILAQAF